MFRLSCHGIRIVCDCRVLLVDWIHFSVGGEWVGIVPEDTLWEVGGVIWREWRCWGGLWGGGTRRCSWGLRGCRRGFEQDLWATCFCQRIIKNNLEKPIYKGIRMINTDVSHSSPVHINKDSCYLWHKAAISGKKSQKDDNLIDNSQQHIYLFIITFLLSKKKHLKWVKSRRIASLLHIKILLSKIILFRSIITSIKVNTNLLLIDNQIPPHHTPPETPVSPDSREAEVAKTRKKVKKGKWRVTLLLIELTGRKGGRRKDRKLPKWSTPIPT